MMNKLIVLFVFLIGSFALFSSPLDVLVGRERADELIKTGYINDIRIKSDVPLLIPEVQFLDSVIRKVWNELEPSLFVENLYLYRKPQGASVTKWTKEQQQKT